MRTRVQPVIFVQEMEQVDTHAQTLVDLAPASMVVLVQKTDPVDMSVTVLLLDIMEFIVT